MSALYLYALLPADAPPPPAPLRGIDDAPVERWTPPAVSAHRVQGWVSRFGSFEPFEPTLARVRAHDGAMAAALSLGSTPLPFRFGHHFESEIAALGTLAPRLPALAAQLSRVRDAVEFRLLVEAPVAAPATAITSSDGSPGRQRIEAARRRQAAADDDARWATALSDRLQPHLASFVLSEVRRTELIRGRRRLTISHLVARSRVDAYLGCLARVPQMADASPPTVIGPSAPYSFAVA